MARVERTLSTAPVPVERAQLIDPGAFRFSFASAETLKQIGGVLEELGKRKIEMQDRIGVSNINAAMENAQREYEKEIIGKPLDQHAAILQKHLNNAKSFAGQQRVTQDTRKLVDGKLQIWGDTFSDLGEIATIKAIERDAVIAVTTDYEKALTEGTPEDIVEAEAALDKQFKGSYEPGEAEKLKTEAEKRAVKQMNESAKQQQMNLAAIKPNQVKASIDTELKARGKGKKSSSEFALLSNTDLETIRDYAGSVGEKVKTDSEIATDTAIEDSYAKIVNGDTDTLAMITGIQSNPGISPTDSIRAADKITTFFGKWNSRIKPESTKDSAIIAMEDAVTDLTEGRITKANYFETYADNKKDLNETDRQRYLREAAPAYGKMIANVKQVAGRAAKARIVSKTEAEFERLRQSVAMKEIPNYILSAASIKNQAEMINYSNYEFSVLDHFSADANKDSTQKQAIDSLGGLGEVWASKDWIETYRNFKATSTELSSLTRDVSAVYNSAINNTRKRGRQKELKNPWKQLDDSKQARIIDMMSNGATIEDVIRSARQGNL